MGLTISYTLEYTIDGETSLSWKSVSQALGWGYEKGVRVD